MADTDVAQLARRRQNFWWLFLLVLCVLLLPLALVTGVLIAGSKDDEGVPLFLWILGGAQFLTLLLVVAGLFWLRRRGVGWAQPPLSMGVDRQRRKAIFRSIRAVEPVPQADQEVADDLARRMSRQRWLALYLPLISLPALIGFIAGDRDTLDWLAVIAFLFMYASLPFLLRDVRRARRWREQYGSPES
ncbi:hypothetical protein [Kineosporia mesophila]|nr:hypothetical protein [Kineosporia mesophila]MCD5352718.1 hypothetical protein [Kineosporia mesophila]